MSNMKGWFVLVSLSMLVSACRAAADVSTPLPNSLSPGYFQVFVEPDAGRQPVLAALRSAQKSIRMAMHWLTDREIIDTLKAARGRGIDVRVILELQPIGSGAGNRPAFNELQAASVSVKMSNPVFRLTHLKAIVIDDRLAFILTFDQVRSAFMGNREYGIIDADPADAAEIAAVFDADWSRTKPILSNPNLVWSPANSRPSIVRLIDSANQTLEIENEEMLDDEVEARLISAAQRGVGVRVVMPSSQTGVEANKPGQEKITQGGVKLRLIKTPYIHGTLVIADQARAFVGSETFSPASLDQNRELGILMTDPHIIRMLSATFEGDWNVGK